MKKYEKLSKEVSYILRHGINEYKLEIDEIGFVSVTQILEILNSKNEWKDICEYDLQKMIKNSNKKRHEIKDGKIRAFYGHSIEKKIVKEEAIPPDILYHGTPKKNIKSIFKDGLLSKSRQYVHLSQDIETAQNVAKRYDENYSILIIDSKKAYNDEIKFYLGNEKIWLADTIPPKYLNEL